MKTLEGLDGFPIPDEPLPIVCERKLIAVHNNGLRYLLAYRVSGPVTARANYSEFFVVEWDRYDKQEDGNVRYVREREAFGGCDSLQALYLATSFLEEMVKFETKNAIDTAYYFAPNEGDNPDDLEEYEHFADV